MNLQGILAEIAEATSVETIERLVEGVGGTSCRIPCVRTVESAPDDHWLVALVGRQDALTIAYMFAHCFIAVPTGRNLFLLKRRQHIRDLIAQGLSSNVIARRAGCHVRTVFRAKAQMAKRAARATPGTPVKGQEL